MHSHVRFCLVSLILANDTENISLCHRFIITALKPVGFTIMS